VGLAFGSKNNNIDNKNSIDENNYLLAKKLYEFSKENSALRFFGAFIGGNFVDTETFLEMAKMPSRETLIARLVGMIQYPLRSLAVALSEVAKKQAT
jgi:large subunit ribosomal protein L10